MGANKVRICKATMVGTSLAIGLALAGAASVMAQDVDAASARHTFRGAN
jgi:hypothetical protein